MNRGAGRRDIYHTDVHRRLFLALLGDFPNRFGVEIHAYCLMGNHYHLLLHTPLGNLSRAMRHLDGVYTQKFNWLTGSDGPLFRGRFKSIVIDGDAYALQVSRYIHRNPVEIPGLTDWTAYPWSSYHAYINRTDSPNWLSRSVIYGLLGGDAKRYRSFVEQGNDMEISKFYASKRISPILGDKRFKERVLAEFKGDRREFPILHQVFMPPSIEFIRQAVCSEFSIDAAGLLFSRRGQSNEARLMAVTLAHECGQLRLTEVAAHFGFRHYTSVSSTMQRYRRKRDVDKSLARREARVLEMLDTNKIMSQDAT